MARTVIELSGVGKRYRLGEHHGSGTDLRETVARFAGRLRGRPLPAPRDFWSLRDVSFSVNEGEAIGIIGSNGAGKSTLLKVMSNITTPTVGMSRTRGRVGSLLEVGTGFHGELTGLENTYLNGAILGMSRREVSQRLDQIIDFAGLERFMDTPVKRYSSGMYLRLGFAIAAHMEADILLVDEVLAVGDADFQRRCLGKMSELEKSGRTVLFVSHNMKAMARLCPNAVWLERGSIREIGPTSSVVEQYLHSGSAHATSVSFGRDPTHPAQFTAAALVDDVGRRRSVLSTQSPAWIEVDLEVRIAVPGLSVAVIISTSQGFDLIDETTGDRGQNDIGRPGRRRVRCLLPPVLAPGAYTISLWMGTSYEDFAMHERAIDFTVEGPIEHPRRRIRLDLQWETVHLDEAVEE